MAVEDKKLSKITTTLLGSAAATLACLLLFRLGVGRDLNQMVIGSIVPLLPGLPFTIAIRDIADGDYIAGSVRMLDGERLLGRFARDAFGDALVHRAWCWCTPSIIA